MNRSYFVLPTALLVIAAPCAGHAQIKTRLGLLIPEISLMTDYRYNGVSNSDRQPTVRASVYLWRPDGFYAGADVSRVRFNDGRGTDVEVVAYGGRNFDHGQTRLSFEGMAILFPDQRHGAPTYSYGQVTAKVRQAFGPVSVAANASWTPQASYHAGPAWTLTADGAWQTTDWMSISGRVGTYESEHRQDRTFWNAGVTFKRKGVALDLRYAGTDLAPAQCFYTDRCEAGLAGKVTFTLPSAFK